MATLTSSPRFAMRPVIDKRLPDGAWWPENRSLSEQFGQLFALWPAEESRIARILYSPPDWDDHPRSVAVPGRSIKAGSFPRDDTHQLILTLIDRQRRSITVIPPGTSQQEAGAVLDGVSGVPHGRGTPPGADRPGADHEGGRLSRDAEASPSDTPNV